MEKIHEIIIIRKSCVNIFLFILMSKMCCEKLLFLRKLFLIYRAFVVIFFKISIMKDRVLVEIHSSNIHNHLIITFFATI